MTAPLPAELQVAASATAWAILLVLSFVPPILFLVWVRNTERHRREPMGVVIRSFLWGAVFSVIVAVVLSLLLLVALDQIEPLYVLLGRGFSDPRTIVLVVVVAPFAEELAKGLGIRSARRRIQEVEDGLVYGAAVGLGFSATENLLYGVAALVEGFAVSIAVIGIRSISSSLLHASASGVFGYGIAKSRLAPGRSSWVPFYFAAVGMHAAFNFLAGFGNLYAQSYGDAAGLIVLVAAIVFALVAISAVRRKIRAIERSA